MKRILRRSISISLIRLALAIVFSTSAFGAEVSIKKVVEALVLHSQAKEFEEKGKTIKAHRAKTSAKKILKRIFKAGKRYRTKRACFLSLEGHGSRYLAVTCGSEVKLQFTSKVETSFGIEKKDKTANAIVEKIQDLPNDWFYDVKFQIIRLRAFGFESTYSTLTGLTVYVKILSIKKSGRKPRPVELKKKEAEEEAVEIDPVQVLDDLEDGKEVSKQKIIEALRLAIQKQEDAE